MTQTFGKVCIVDFFDPSRSITSMYSTEEDYMNAVNKNKGMVEIIGKENQQIKPVFDVDAYDTDLDVNGELQRLSNMFKGKTVNYAKREPRMVNGKMKYSYRFYVEGVRIRVENLKKLCKMAQLDQIHYYDMSIYKTNQVLYTPYTSKKADNRSISNLIDVPVLTPVNCTIFDCCGQLYSRRLY